VASRTAHPQTSASSSWATAVLGLVVAGYTYRRYSELAEGQLAKVRAAVVNARVLADVARSTASARHCCSVAARSIGCRTKASLLADATER